MTTMTESEEVMPDGSIRIESKMERPYDEVAMLLAETIAYFMYAIGISVIIFFIGLVITIIGLIKKKKKDNKIASE